MLTLFESFLSRLTIVQTSQDTYDGTIAIGTINTFWKATFDEHLSLLHNYQTIFKNNIFTARLVSQWWAIGPSEAFSAGLYSEK